MMKKKNTKSQIQDFIKYQKKKGKKTPQKYRRWDGSTGEPNRK